MVYGGFMSRTHKDKPHNIIYPEDNWDFDFIPLDANLGSRTGFRYIQVAGKKTKKRRNYCHFRWYSTTPSWWTRITMTRPQRRRGRVWEHTVLKAQDLELVDPPTVGRKPHIYYY